MKNKVINAILMDDLKGAESLIPNHSEGFEMLSSLLKEVKSKPFPLSELKAKAPKYIGIHLSYTCGLQCEMCNSGFQDRTFLYRDYKYLLPEQFDKLSFWINSASDITFVGVGETLNSPHIDYFVKKIANKHSVIFTNGIPLSKKKIELLINYNLNVMVLSFDGKLSLGHGKGEKEYIQWFWNKVKQIQEIKETFRSSLPLIKLTIAVADENLNDLDNIIAAALRHGINHVMLALMSPCNKNMFDKSVFVNFNESKRKINSIVSKWNKRGAVVTVSNYRKKLYNAHKVCLYVDNWIFFHGRNSTFRLCCGSIDMPVYFFDTPQMNYWNSFPFRYFRYLHFCLNREDLPITCKNCWSINLKKHAQDCVTFNNHLSNKKDSSFNLLVFYKSASVFKKNNQNKKAEKLFLKILQFKPEPELMGKIYFHLGEIELKRKDYRKALRFMKLSVQYCFNHAMAFAYLYLLLMRLEKKNLKKRRRRAKILIPQ